MTGKYWDEVTKKDLTPSILQWGHSNVVRDHLTTLYLPQGKHLSNQASVAEADSIFFRHYSNCDYFENALSIGCGLARKEFYLLKNNIVGSFDFYDLSEQRVLLVREYAKKHNLNHRVNVECSDPLLTNNYKTYDLIFWTGALHHMRDMDYAMRWCNQHLRKGAIIFFHEYVGPNYLQFSDSELRLANSIRSLLPDDIFYIPDSNKQHPRIIGNIGLDKILKCDPSEAVQSELIIPLLSKYFSSVKTIDLGGLVWFLALRNLYKNFENKNLDLLKKLLQLDIALIDAGFSYNAVGFGIKD